MPKVVLLLFGLFLRLSLANAQIYSPIPVTGFNHDVVAEGIGTSSLATTTKEMDAVPISNFVMCTEEFAAANNFTPAGLYGLPDDGLVSTTNRSFQFAPFDEDNVLYLFPTEVGTLTLNTPARYTNISLLTLSTEGSSTVSVSFDFTDGTHQVETRTISDWFDNIISPFNSYGRLKRKDGPFTAAADYAGAENGKPVLSMVDFTLPCTKTVASITITNTSGTISSTSFRSFILAVSGLEIILTPTITVAASDTVICEGAVVTFNAASTNGGTAPEYLWKVNNSFAGNNNTTFTTSTLHDGDIVTCLLTSNLACASPASVVSKAISIKVNPMLAPWDSISVSDDSICAGTPVTFEVFAVNGGSSPSYQWELNDSPVGTNSTFYTSDSLENGDKIRCQLTSNAICLIRPTDLSNRITMQVTPVYQLQISPIDTLNANGVAVPLTGSPAGGVFSGTGVSGVQFNPSVTGAGNFTVTYRLPDNACTEPVTMDIPVRQLPCDLNPETAFTPNEDGKNDLWEIGIFNSACILSAKVEVYNRWGKQVFDSDNYKNNWDGKQNGKDLLVGTYFFIITYKTADSPVELVKNGMVTILR